MMHRSVEASHDSYGESSRGFGATPQQHDPYKILLYTVPWPYDRLALPDFTAFPANKSPGPVFSHQMSE